MEWLDSIAGLLTGAASGGIFGFLGSAAGAVAKHFQLKAEREFKQLEWAHEDKLFEQQMQRTKLEHDQQIEVVAQEGSWAGLETTVKHDSVLTAHSHKWVNDVKSLFRPFLTTVLVAAEVFIFWNLWVSFATGETNTLVEILNSPGNPVTEILKYVIYSIVFAAQTAVVWWFGDRAFAPPGMKNR